MKKILLIENGSRHTRALAHRLGEHEVRRVKYRNLSAGDIAKADIIVLSGGHPSVLYHSWFYRKQVDLIRTSSRPIIGICLGFELIVRAFGGRLYRLKRKAHGLRLITVAPGFPAFGGPLLRIWEAHKWAATFTPESVFEIVASSQYGSEIIKHRSKPIYACQFHPEVDSPLNDGPQVLRTILGMIDLDPMHAEGP